MPSDPKEFRENATRCLAMAAETHPIPILRENLLETAQRWLRLATEIEATESLPETRHPKKLRPR